MNKDIKDLQDLWQGEQSSPTDQQQLIDNLNSVEKKAKRERWMMLVTFFVTIVILLFILPVMESWYYLFSITILGFAMLMIIFLVHRTKFHSLSNGKDFSNQQFITSHIQKLKDKITIASKYMWVYGILITAGINVGYLEALKEMTLSSRVGYHVLATVLILAAMCYGVKKKMDEYSEEVTPLISQLNELNK